MEWELMKKKKITFEKITGKELMDQLGISIFEGMIIKNGTIVSESEILTSDDKIKVLNVIHGG
ncbi:MAG TPA: hypothetical protein VK444_08840 [Methanobacteriaceae archaeon]|nr:hypothetical protein [Methanobacteriaceae archaeon]